MIHYYLILYKDTYSYFAFTGEDKPETMLRKEVLDNSILLKVDSSLIGKLQQKFPVPYFS